MSLIQLVLVTLTVNEYLICINFNCSLPIIVTVSVCCCWRRTVWTWTVTPGATVLLQLCIMTLPFNLYCV